MDDRLLRIIEKRGGDPSLYLPVYTKCLSKPQKLVGDEYHLGQHLFEWGFMQVKYTPKWKKGSFVGNDVEFLSMRH